MTTARFVGVRAYRIMPRVSSRVRNLKTPWLEPPLGGAQAAIGGKNGWLPVAMISSS